MAGGLFRKIFPAYEPPGGEAPTPETVSRPRSPDLRPWYKRKRFAIPIGLVVAFFAIGIIGEIVNPPKKTTVVRTAGPATAPTTAAPVTTAKPVVTTTPAPTTTLPAGMTVTPFTEVRGDHHPSARNLEAFDICKQFVTKELTAPLGAVWRDPSGDQVIYRGAADGSGPVYVNASVDSKNAFGTLVRSHYVCSVISDGNHKWHLDDLQIDGQ